ncbi:MAG: tRNA (adenosine(37)-N6)-dimethylallyltransferase MiaA [Desulfuromonadales bacterium]|nr:tRNA (adenosine(37)-N6)-dimethylallyltransferase MiaA [Desulfuromonadales bacterium]
MIANLCEKASVVVLCGPTASGKTGLVCQLAGQFDIEVVSADSRQVYRLMDIGTAKPTRQEQQTVSHHLIDLVDPDHPFSVADFVERGRSVIAGILARGHLPVIVGGTGLYIRALIDGLIDAPAADEALRQSLLAYEQREGKGALYRRLQQVDKDQAEIIHPNNMARIIRALEVFELGGIPLSVLQKRHAFGDSPYRLLKLYLNPPRSILGERIDQRVEQMISDGLFAEVQSLLDAGYAPELKALKTIGYRESISCLCGALSADEAIDRIKLETRQYARRQQTWFKKEKSIISVDSSAETDTISSMINCFLMQKGSGYG